MKKLLLILLVLLAVAAVAIHVLHIVWYGFKPGLQSVWTKAVS